MEEFEEMYFFENSYRNLIRRRHRRRHRRVWVNEIFMYRKQLGEYHHLFEELKLQPMKFFEYFRMCFSTFQYILNAVEPLITKQNTNYRECISPTERLAITLRYLATGHSFRSLAFSFRVSNSAVGIIVRETCKAIFDSLVSHHMPMPTDEMIHQNVELYWSKWGFPNCIGSLDGKHIRMKCPSNSGSMYYNYKKFFSIVLQAVASPDYKFLFIEVGAYGQQSDGGTFASSAMYRQFENGYLNISKCLPNTNTLLPLVLLADEAYPLKRYIMRPYPRRNLGEQETIYNERLSNARVVIECAFGIITQKWRILTKCIETTTENAETIVKCICLLHNIVIAKEGQPRHNHSTDQRRNLGQRSNYASRGQNRSTTEAYNIREAFKHFFSNENMVQ
ncbi:unnamed protein product [Parnassius apollo]|uniref:(apollo) hypothetical protein n=1 Tax=Parnassius apollo TaxID=110799 RepID=A0A8S3Y3A5_PARAO|nr:unnamed protein product [Parnassius apollo]